MKQEMLCSKLKTWQQGQERKTVQSWLTALERLHKGIDAISTLTQTLTSSSSQ